MTRILIADDNRQSLLLLERTLRGHGYDVVAVENGADALYEALQCPPDIIVTDILMPVMDGFELCRRWKSHEQLKNIPLIFYTCTYTDPKDERFALSLGGDRFMIKPQRAEAILQTVRDLLREREAADPAVCFKPRADEVELLRQHKDALFRKLEKKVQQLECEIAEREKTEEERLKLFRQVEEDARTKAELLREVNHRVKNNLMTILGLMLAEQRDTPAEGRHFVKTAIDNLTHRIQGLLEVHHMLSESQWAPMSLSRLADRVVRVVTETAPRDRRIAVEIEPSPIEVSPRQANTLALVFTELATNTLKHAVSVKDKVRVSVRVSSEGGMIRVEYRDDGPGYPQDVLEGGPCKLGMNLIRRLVTETLRGRLEFTGEGGAAVTLYFKPESTSRT
jgi:two-component sensor histidine kinase/CheY-like chemotaxis protein